VFPALKNGDDFPNIYPPSKVKIKDYSTLTFFAEQLAGNLAGLPSNELNTIAMEYIGARLLYTTLYMGVKSELTSYLRSGIWAWSIALPIWGLVKAGRALSVNSA
jgi:uncharacterized MAPEG superfamily protein